jgi:ethanolamine utilization protein EutA
MFLHEGDEPHFHEWSEAERNALAETIWKAENVELATVGIDIGSSTSHLMFARVHLQRKTQLLSSEFVVVSREILWRSPILLTPFLPDYTIDAAQLKEFIDSAYEAAEISAEGVDSGAVILTGEAIKRRNAEAIAGIFASQAGKFVCASAGHHMECVLAAHGSGASAVSRRTHRTILNVDIGGGTTKLALVKNGEVAGTCAIAVGGRLIVRDEQGRLVRAENSARQAGLRQQLGERVSDNEVEQLVDRLADAIIEMIKGPPTSALAKALLLTEPPDDWPVPHCVTFSGGVSEYLFKRENQSFGDIARPLAERIRRAFNEGRIAVPMMDPGQGIRATVIGASQFTVQLSGKTIHLSAHVALPVRNVPVTFPALELGERVDAVAVTKAITLAFERMDEDAGHAVALGIRWRGEPHYQRLRNLAAGIAQAIDPQAAAPLILMIDRDVGRLLGHILEHELGVTRGVVSIDGLQLREFDYVDIGERVEPSQVVPVVIKSLLFPVQ